MSLETKLVALAQAIGTDVKGLTLAQGVLANLTTTQKTSLVAAINEIQAALATAGVVIDDVTASTTSVYSSSKTNAEIAAQVTAAIDALVAGAPAALDTLNEIAAAVSGNDSELAALLTAVNNRVRFDAAQTLTAPQQLTARTNIGAVSSADIGNPDADLTATYAAAKA